MVRQGGTRLARYVRGELMAGIRFLADNPEVGHWRKDLTTVPVKFWPVFSYLIVYEPATRPLGIARVLHSDQDLAAIFLDDPPKA